MPSPTVRLGWIDGWAEYWGIGSGGQGAGDRLGKGYAAGPGRPAPKSSVLIEACAKVGARNGIGGLV